LGRFGLAGLAPGAFLEVAERDFDQAPIAAALSAAKPIDRIWCGAVRCA
jgi:hypothetical protein